MTSLDSEAGRSLDHPNLRPAAFAHIVIRTPNYERMRTFYKLLLNAEYAFENDFSTFLRYDEEHHRVVLLNMPHLEPMPGVRTAGVEHFAYAYRSLGELLGNYLRLKAAGIKPSWCINHGMTTSIYYHDPDGNLAETQFDNLDVAAADAFMRSAYFGKNAAGVDFDPELLIERYRRGDPMEELVRQGSAPHPQGVIPVRPPGLPDYDYAGLLLDR